MIVIRNLTIEPTPGRRILNDVSVQFSSGAIHAIIGPNGSGKTTLLRAAAGLILLPYESNVAIDNKSLSGLKTLDRAELISYVESQHIAPFAYTVRDVVLWGRWTRHKGLPSAADNEAASDSAEIAGIYELLDRPFTELSTGERKKTLLAQSLASRSKHYIWDEPLGPLDLQTGSKLMAHARKMANTGYTFLISFHDVGIALRLADSVTILDGGHVNWHGGISDPSTLNRIEHAFGVKAHEGGIYFS